MAETLAVVNCSQLVTLAGARRPRTGGDLRQLAIIEDGAMLVRGDTIEAAANLYSYLRRLDASGAAAIGVAPIPTHGLGDAIRDRLKRAAAAN